MKYHYHKSNAVIPIYGIQISLNHSVYRNGTLYSDLGVGLIVVQRKFDSGQKVCYWDAVDPGIANDIYLADRFYSFFKEHATTENYPIFQLRKLMWALRMKPLPREEWEQFF